MRKLHTTILGIVCLYPTSSLFSQTPSEAELAKQAASLYRSANIDSFFNWFLSPACSNFLFLLLIASGIYFLGMLTLFLLINRDVIKIKENPLVQILLEDWLVEKSKIRPIEKVEPVVTTDLLTETIIQLDLPNLDILSMKQESTTKVANDTIYRSLTI